ADDASREPRRSAAGRRFPSRAVLGISAARVKRGEREALGKLLLGLWPVAAQAIEANAAEHRLDGSWCGGPGVSDFEAALSLLKYRGDASLVKWCPTPFSGKMVSDTIFFGSIMSSRVATKLSVNLNKVALLRNQRDVGYPSVTRMADLVIGAGAHGITVHPRPDERHVRRMDVYELAELLAQKHAGRIELNIEGNPTDDLLALVLDVKPDQATLVPDSPDQRTSDHGWNFAADGARLRPIVARLKAAGVRVSLFVDPVVASVSAAADVGADR